MAATRSIIILPLVAFILVHCATVYNRNAQITCGGLRCPSGAAGCSVSEMTDSNNNTTITAMCINSLGRPLTKSVKSYSPLHQEFMPIGSWWNSTWGNNTGYWNWTRFDLSGWESQVRKDYRNAADDIQKELNKIKNLLH